MMNNKGQTLVLFIIFIPILLLLAAFVIDTGMIIHESNRLKSVTKTVLKDTFYENREENKIKTLLKENDINIENIKITITNNSIRVKNSYETESVFGKIIGLNNYNIKIDITAKEETGNIKFIKE